MIPYYRNRVPTFTKETILLELKFVEKEFESDKDEVVFCHSDVWWTNIIYKKSFGDQL